MAARTKPPFRADHVGSLLRPKELLQARRDRAAGRISAAELRTLEDEAIRKVVKMQEDVGLQGVTDGEYRRIDWFMDFKYAIGGIEKLADKVKVPFEIEGGKVDFEFVAYRVGEKIRLNGVIFAEDFRFLKSVTKATPKLTIPSPSMMHYPAGRGVDRQVYPDMEEFLQDVAKSTPTRSKASASSAAAIFSSMTRASPFSTIRSAAPRSVTTPRSSIFATLSCSTRRLRTSRRA